MTFSNFVLLSIAFIGFGLYYRRTLRSRSRRVVMPKKKGGRTNPPGPFDIGTRLDDCEGNILPINDNSIG